MFISTGSSRCFWCQSLHFRFIQLSTMERNNFLRFFLKTWCFWVKIVTSESIGMMCSKYKIWLHAKEVTAVPEVLKIIEKSKMIKFAWIINLFTCTHTYTYTHAYLYTNTSILGIWTGWTQWIKYCYNKSTTFLNYCAWLKRATIENSEHEPLNRVSIRI